MEAGFISGSFGALEPVAEMVQSESKNTEFTENEKAEDPKESKDLEESIRERAGTILGDASSSLVETSLYEGWWCLLAFTMRLDCLILLKYWNLLVFYLNEKATHGRIEERGVFSYHHPVTFSSTIDADVIDHDEEISDTPHVPPLDLSRFCQIPPEVIESARQLSERKMESVPTSPEVKDEFAGWVMVTMDSQCVNYFRIWWTMMQDMIL